MKDELQTNPYYRRTELATLCHKVLSNDMGLVLIQKPLETVKGKVMKCHEHVNSRLVYVMLAL